jgi:hypothetical protein
LRPGESKPPCMEKNGISIRPDNCRPIRSA